MLSLPFARQFYRALLLAVALGFALSCWRAESSPPTDHERQVLADQKKHLESLGVPRWRQAGVRGDGIKVAVLDTGFRGYREQLGKTLPAQVPARSFRRDGNLEARDSNHGVMCGEVIHAFAPDAEVIFANWEPDHPETFIAAAKWCREQGAGVVTCSVIMPAWGDGEGGGLVHRELAAIFGKDVLAFACAGNLAPRHWGGAFDNDGHSYHRWDKAHDDNAVMPWNSERVSLELTCGPSSGYALELLDGSDSKPIGEMINYRGADRRVAIVRFVPQVGHSYRLRVKHVDGKPGTFHLAALGAWLEHAVSRGSIPFPGDGAEWLTVAAVDAEGRRAAYSSCGPNSSRPKPDLSAPVPFPTLCRNAPFSGTSAAAPQAAGLAALVWSRHRDWSADGVRNEMIKSCRDLGPPGHDDETGFGRINLPINP
jgi:subtilisin family serine protease